MHPPLHKKHSCDEQVAALTMCHEDHSFTKWFGFCNDEKAALDRCFRAEKKTKAAASLIKARAFDAKFEAMQEKLCEQKK